MQTQNCPVPRHRRFLVSRFNSDQKQLPLHIGSRRCSHQGALFIFPYWSISHRSVLTTLWIFFIQRKFCLIFTTSIPAGKLLHMSHWFQDLLSFNRTISSHIRCPLKFQSVAGGMFHIASNLSSGISGILYKLQLELQIHLTRGYLMCFLRFELLSK